MGKCRNCKHFKLRLYGLTCEKNRRIIVGGHRDNCDGYEPKEIQKVGENYERN